MLITGASFALVSSTSPARAQAACEEAAELAVLPSPVAPWKGAPLRVIFAAEKPLDGELSLIAPDGSVAAKSRERHGGPPYFWFAEVASPAAGTWRATLARERRAGRMRHHHARHRRARRRSRRRRAATAGSVWPLRNTWNRATENLFSAWIEKLFDAPLDAEPSWPALHEVLRDHSRNVLFNHLGLGEDEMKIVLRPDCADLPYFLRAYFAFKMGLPFGYSICSRGGGGRRRAARVVRHSASRTRGRAAARAVTPPPARRSPGPAHVRQPQQPAAAPPRTEAGAETLGLAASFGAYLPTRRQRRAFRIGRAPRRATTTPTTIPCR